MELKAAVEVMTKDLWVGLVKFVLIITVEENASTCQTFRFGGREGYLAASSNVRSRSEVLSGLGERDVWRQQVIREGGNWLVVATGKQ